MMEKPWETNDKHDSFMSIFYKSPLDFSLKVASGSCAENLKCFYPLKMKDFAVFHK